MSKPITRSEFLVSIIVVALILTATVVFTRSQKKAPAYPPMCFVSGPTELTGYEPATWVERHGLKNLVQKFVIFDCPDGRQFVVPWVKQGGAAAKDTH